MIDGWHQERQNLQYKNQSIAAPVFYPNQNIW